MTDAKFIGKVLVILLTLALIVSMAACSKQNTDATTAETTAETAAATEAATQEGSKTADAAETQAAQQTEAPAQTGEKYGNITVAVPEGMYAVTDEDGDADSVTITKDDDSFTYYMISAVDTEAEGAGGIDTTKEMNDGSSEITVEAGTTWKGVTYDFLGTPVFHIYGAVDGRVAVVQSYGFAADSDQTKALLSSIRLAKAE